MSADFVSVTRACPIDREETMALIGYARVSTGGQSLEVQLRALAECNKVFQEKVSGASDDRPQLTLLLDYVKEGDVMMVTKLVDWPLEDPDTSPLLT